MKKRDLSDAHADVVVRAMQDGVSSLVNKSGPPFPHWKRQMEGTDKGGGGTPTPPQM